MGSAGLESKMAEGESRLLLSAVGERLTIWEKKGMNVNRTEL